MEIFGTPFYVTLLKNGFKIGHNSQHNFTRTNYIAVFFHNGFFSGLIYFKTSIFQPSIQTSVDIKSGINNKGLAKTGGL